MFVQHSGIVLVFLCFPHHFPHFLHQTHIKPERAPLMTCRVRTSQSTTKRSARHRSTALLLPKGKVRESGGKLNRKWKGKHGKALCHRFLLMFLFYLFWMLHCIYLQLLYLHMSIRFCHFLSESPIRSTLKGWFIGPANHFQSKPQFHVPCFIHWPTNWKSMGYQPRLTFLGTISWLHVFFVSHGVPMASGCELDCLVLSLRMCAAFISFIENSASSSWMSFHAPRPLHLSISTNSASIHAAMQQFQDDVYRTWKSTWLQHITETPTCLNLRVFRRNLQIRLEHTWTPLLNWATLGMQRPHDKSMTASKGQAHMDDHGFMDMCPRPLRQKKGKLANHQKKT